MPDSQTAKITLLITRGQYSRLKLFCKQYRISASQLYRLWVDELKVEYPELPLRRKIQTDSLKIQDFLGVHDQDRPIHSAYSEEDIGNGNGNGKRHIWYKKAHSWFWRDSAPI